MVQVLLAKEALSKIQAIIIAVVLIVAAFGGIAYYWSLTPPAPPSEEMEIIYEWNGDIVTNDPHVGWSATTLQIARVAYDRLVELKGSTMELEPSLAESWEISPDGLEYTFNLRKDVKFADGSPFNATVVKASFERLFGIGQQTANYVAIKEIEVLGTYEVKFVLDFPFGPFMYALALKFASITNPNAVEKHKTTDDIWAMNYFHDHTNGTGPYRLKKWKKGESWILVRNPHYWRGWEGSHATKITGLIVTERATVMMMLEKGEIDISSHIPREEVPKFQINPYMRVVEYPALSTFYLTLNSQKPPTDDVHVRRALSYALDYTSALAFIEYHGKQARGSLPRAIPGWSEETFQYSYDLEKAREELAQSRYPDGGFTLDLIWCSGNEDQRKVALLWQSSLAELNIGLNIEEVTWPTLTAITTNPETARHIVCLYNFVNMPHAHAANHRRFHSSAIPPAGGYNWCYYNNSMVDNLLDEAVKETDPERSAELYQEADQIVTEEAACVFVWEETRIEVMGTWVHGYVPNPCLIQQYNFYDMYTVEAEKP